MAIHALADNFAPYASFDSVKKVIQRAREKGLPDQITAGTLEQISVPASMASFVLRTLVFLSLMDEDGNVTEAFTQLRRASTDEYPPSLGEIVRKAYLKVFQIADPAIHGPVEIGDAFRVYEPLNQREKMVRLFMGLCEEAQIITPGSVKHRTRSATPKARTPSVGASPVEAGAGQGVRHSPPPTPPPGYIKTVTLGNIGTITLSVSVNPLELKGKLRNWFYELTDKLDECPTEEPNPVEQAAVRNQEAVGA